MEAVLLAKYAIIYIIRYAIIYIIRSVNHRARREAVLRQATEGAAADGAYTGANNYIDYRQGFRREHTIGNEKGTGTHGPLRASTNVRMSVRCVFVQLSLLA